MNKVAKVFLVGCGSLVLLGLVAVAGLAWWVKDSDFIAEGQAMRQQGVEAGAKLAGTACIDAALLRPRDGFGDALDARVWLDGCLEGSDPGEAVCAGVPPQTEIMKSVEWRLAQCQAYGAPNDNGCSNLLAAVQGYCEARAPAPGG